METGKNKSTNNFIIRLWSKKHFKGKYWNIFDGTIQDVRTGEQAHFHSVGKMLELIEKYNELAEKNKNVQ